MWPLLNGTQIEHRTVKGPLKAILSHGLISYEDYYRNFAMAARSADDDDREGLDCWDTLLLSEKRSAIVTFLHHLENAGSTPEVNWYMDHLVQLGIETFMEYKDNVDGVEVWKQRLHLQACLQALLEENDLTSADDEALKEFASQIVEDEPKFNSLEDAIDVLEESIRHAEGVRERVFKDDQVLALYLLGDDEREPLIFSALPSYNTPVIPKVSQAVAHDYLDGVRHDPLDRVKRMEVFFLEEKCAFDHGPQWMSETNPEKALMAR